MPIRGHSEKHRAEAPVSHIEYLTDLAERLRAIVVECERDPANAQRLMVMRQNPANNHYWSKSCGALTLDDVRIAASAIEKLLEIFTAANAVMP